MARRKRPGPGWRKLQQRTMETLREQVAPHLFSMEAWEGVYLPINISPTEIQIEEHPTLLSCGSVPGLIDELNFLTEKSGLESL